MCSPTVQKAKWHWETGQLFQLERTNNDTRLNVARTDTKMCIFITIVLDWLVVNQEKVQNAFEGVLEDLKVVQQKNTYIFNQLSAMVNFS